MTGPLDQALELLRAHRLPYRWSENSLTVWLSVCPSCRTAEWCLRISEPRRGGPISLICSTGCTEEQIVHALEADPEAVKFEDALGLAEECREVAARALELAARRVIA